MPEKEPQVTFTDRRKISSDGEIRPGVAESEAQEEKRRQAEISKRQPMQPSPSRPRKTQGLLLHPAQLKPMLADPDPKNSYLRDRWQKESADSNAAYQETTQQLDDLLRAKTPDSSHLGPIVFDHLVQSMYMTAMMSLGAGTQPGEKLPRIDSDGCASDHRFAGSPGGKNQGKT